MEFLLEKLSAYWQLRFAVVGVGIALIVYATLLPDPGNQSHDTIPSVAAAPLPGSDPFSPAPTNSSAVSTASAKDSGLTAAGASAPWLGENHAVAEQLRIAADQQRSLPRDFSESIHELRKAAEQGSPAAQTLLGHAYELGAGVSKNMMETVRWYDRAAEARSAQGTTASSQPAPKDFPEAFEAYRQAAEQGNAAAQLYMGLAYDAGRDVPRDAMEAMRWYRKAASQGSRSAANNLGVLYHNGDSVPKDSMEAAVWFRSAAERGNASAQYSLGRLYYQGDGVPQDFAEAAEWLGRAAAQGNAQAQVLLSLLYATGRGVSGSTPMAYMWINLASVREDRARASRDEIEKLIPAGQIAEGQRLTREWLAKHAQPAS